MKINSRFFALLLASSSVASLAQTTAPSSAASAPLAADPATQIATMQKKLDDWPQLKRYRADDAALPAPAAGEQRVVFYGDSITDAWGRRPNTGTFFPGKPYINRGISGQTTSQMLVRFRQDVINLHPAAVVILAGTNDVAGNTGTMNPDMTEDDFKSMVDLARANGIKVVITSITPASDYPWHRGMQPAQKIKALNSWLERYCQENGIIWVDYYSALTDDVGGMKAGTSFDGVHPNEKGYAIMAPLAQAGIDRALAGR